MDIEIDDLGPEEEPVFLAGLNACFQNWGEREQFLWVYRRDAGAGAADLMLARSDGQVIGGTGVTYRNLESRHGGVKVAIMTGSWTLPEARGKGCFSAMIEAMIEKASEREAALLIGFCFKANKSYSRLLAAGYASVDSFYIRDAREYEPIPDPPPLATLDVGDRSEVLAASETGSGVEFRYSVAQWREQFLGGPYPKAFLSLPDGSIALVEEAFGFLRVLSLSVRSDWGGVLSALLEVARSRRSRLFLFSMDPRVARLAVEQGCEIIEGALIAKITNREVLESWVKGAGQASEEQLVVPGGEWYLGPWRVQNRDRM